MTDPNAKLVAIASGKGGVGKTFIAATLAHALAHEGKRILLCDGDLGLANIDVQLGLAPEFDLGQALAGHIPFARAVGAYAGGMSVRGGFDILAGRSGSGALARLTAPEIGHLLRELLKLSANYDRVVLDLGAGLDASVLHLADAAADCLVVVTDEPTSLTDAYVFIKTLVAKGSRARISVVVNQATDASDGRKTWDTLVKACRQFLNTEPTLSGIVRRDPKVKDAIRRQQALLARSPQSPAASDIVALAKGLNASLVAPSQKLAVGARIR